MFNKNSNKTLWIVFAVLLIAVILIFSTESTKKERSFKSDIVEIDTSAVSSFTLYPKSKPGTQVNFLKDNGIWRVSGSSGNSYTVPQHKINGLFNELLRIKPKRIAARSKNKWQEYQVDSNSTRIVLFEDGSEVLNLIIGKFSFQQPRSMSTFVRLMDENDVYEVDGFLDMTFNKDLNSFRNETIVNSDKNEWNKISFSSLEGLPFELTKVDGKWMVNGIPSDSAKTSQTLNTLSRLTSTDFIDNIDETQLPPEVGKVVIENESGNLIEISAFKNEETYIVKSSENIENYFDGNKVGEKIFITKESLFN